MQIYTYLLLLVAVVFNKDYIVCADDKNFITNKFLKIKHKFHIIKLIFG